MNAVLNTLFEQQTLTKNNAKDALIQIASGESTPSQIAAFMTVFLLRKISADELAGFREALLSLCTKVDLSEYEPMDLCGTGGDNKNTFNISTLASFVAAGAGVKIAKHGNNAVSSSCGSSNVLEFFGYKFSDSEDVLKADMERAGICFLHAPLFHPALKRVAEIRKELKVKTFFNMLGPLINPAFPKKQVLGVYSEELAELYAQILQQTEIEYAIIHTLEGYDEISLTGPYRLISRGSDTVVDPEQTGFKLIKAEAILGGDTVEESARIFMDILSCNGSAEQNEVVVANAATAIQCYFPQISFADAVAMARESLLSKKALTTFKKLIK